jgi:hypothetical protein
MKLLNNRRIDQSFLHSAGKMPKGTSKFGGSSQAREDDESDAKALDATRKKPSSFKRRKSVRNRQNFLVRSFQMTKS